MKNIIIFFFTLFTTINLNAQIGGGGNGTCIPDFPISTLGTEHNTLLDVFKQLPSSSLESVEVLNEEIFKYWSSRFDCYPQEEHDKLNIVNNVNRYYDEDVIKTLQSTGVSSLALQFVQKTNNILSKTNFSDGVKAEVGALLKLSGEVKRSALAKNEKEMILGCIYVGQGSLEYWNANARAWRVIPTPDFVKADAAGYAVGHAIVGILTGNEEAAEVAGTAMGGIFSLFAMLGK